MLQWKECVGAKRIGGDVLRTAVKGVDRLRRDFRRVVINIYSATLTVFNEHVRTNYQQPVYLWTKVNLHLQNNCAARNCSLYIFNARRIVTGGMLSQLCPSVRIARLSVCLSHSLSVKTAEDIIKLPIVGILAQLVKLSNYAHSY